jgi:hypothetical protein
MNSKSDAEGRKTLEQRSADDDKSVGDARRATEAKLTAERGTRKADHPVADEAGDIAGRLGKGLWDGARAFGSSIRNGWNGTAKTAESSDPAIIKRAPRSRSKPSVQRGSSSRREQPSRAHASARDRGQRRARPSPKHA